MNVGSSRRRCSRGLRRLDEARHVHPPERPPTRAPSHKRVCGVAPVEVEHVARVDHPAHPRSCPRLARARAIAPQGPCRGVHAPEWHGVAKTHFLCSRYTFWCLRRLHGQISGAGTGSRNFGTLCSQAYIFGGQKHTASDFASTACIGARAASPRRRRLPAQTRRHSASAHIRQLSTHIFSLSLSRHD